MLVILGLALCTLSYHLEFENDYGFFCYSFLLINLGFSGVCCLFVIMRENLKLKMDQSRGRADQDDDLTTTGKIKVVIFECLFLMVIPYPFFIGLKNVYFDEMINQDIYYHLNDYLYLASLLRFLYFSKSFVNITIWKTRSASRICTMYGCEPGLNFTIKCMMKDTPSQFNLILLGLDLFFFTLALRISEAPVSRVLSEYRMNNYIDCL